MTITDILQQLGIEYRGHGESPHVTQGWVGIRCVWCADDARKDAFGLGIHLDSKACRCWKCGSHSTTEALALASNQRRANVRQLLDDHDPDLRPDPIKGTLRLPGGLTKLLKPHRDYLWTRSFDCKALASTYSLKAIGLAPQYAWTIFIPIQLHWKTVSWTTRTLSDDGRRYVNAPREDEEIPAKHLLYGEDFCGHTAIVCEGPTDVWRVGPGAVATFGLAYTQQQVKRIAEFPTRVVCFDNEPKAQEVARQLTDQLSPYPGRTINVNLDAPDPGSASPKEIKWLRNKYL